MRAIRERTGLTGRGGTAVGVPLVTYGRLPLMTFREWVAFSIGMLVGGGISCAIVWFIGVRQ